MAPARPIAPRACALIVAVSLAAAAAAPLWCVSTCGVVRSARAEAASCHERALRDTPAVQSTDCHQHDQLTFTRDAGVRPTHPVLTPSVDRWLDAGAVAAPVASVAVIVDSSPPRHRSSSTLRI
jgi:hypothetical protein